MLLVLLEAGHVLPLRRAPDVRAACTEAYGPQHAPSVTPLRELLSVLAAVLARRGVRDLTATDTDPRALACARANLARSAPYARVVEADLFPPGRAGLVVCNPPWLPASPSSPLDRAVYDPHGRMLRGFLAGLAARLAPAGEGWLVLSDLAVRLGLRPPAELPDLIAAAGLRIEGRLHTGPRHPCAADPGDPLHAARAAEVTSLWRLRAAG